MTTMRVTRSVPALEHLIGLEARLEDFTAIVRADMRRTLSAEERESYNGIVQTGAPNTYFQTIYVETTEALINGEGNSFIAEPSDRLGEYYCFALGRGVIASLRLDFIMRVTSPRDVPLPRSELTFEQLNSSARSGAERKRAAMEQVLQEAATDFVYWACDQTPPDLASQTVELHGQEL